MKTHISERHVVAWAHLNSFEGFIRPDAADAQRLLAESGGKLGVAESVPGTVPEPCNASRSHREPAGNCPCSRCEQANRCRSECGAFRAYLGSGRWIAAPTETKQ